MFKRAVAPSHAHKFACSVIWLFTVWCSAFLIMNSKPSASTLEVVVYNPMVANCKTRVQQICNELHNAHVICLPGTAKKHDPLLNTCVDSHMGRFTSHSWGWKKNQGINKSCGTTILVRRDLFPIKNFKCHYHPPDKLLGRAGAVRYCRDNMDVIFACTFVERRQGVVAQIAHDVPFFTAFISTTIRHYVAFVSTGNSVWTADFSTFTIVP